jgi:hypothetical protein
MGLVIVGIGEYLPQGAIDQLGPDVCKIPVHRFWRRPGRGRCRVCGPRLGRRPSPYADFTSA